MFEVSDRWKEGYPEAAVGILALRKVAYPNQHEALDVYQATP